MSITRKCRTAALILVTVAGAIMLVQIFRAWLQPSITLSLLEEVFLCR